MNSVRSTNHHRVAMLLRLIANCLDQMLQLGHDHIHAGNQLQRQRRIQHIRTGHTQVNVAPCIPHIFIHIGEEGDHIMLDFRLNFQDALWIKICLCLDGLYCFSRNIPQLCLGFTDCNFDLQPCLELISFCPQIAHFGQGITLYQGSFSRLLRLQLKHCTTHLSAVIML